MNHLALYVHVPCATFRDSHSREYGKTYMIPPPSTVYGMLLALVGETDDYRHCGVKLALAMLSQPRKSIVLRQLRRFKVKDYSDPRNTVPEHQEILTGIKFIVWIDSQGEQTEPTLRERVYQARTNPAGVKRFGCLYLGESSDLVNSVKLASQRHLSQCRWWLIQDDEGFITLPYWVDHVSSRDTRWLRYRLMEMSIQSPPDAAWTKILAPICKDV